MKRHGGTMIEEDLAKFSGEWVEPISTTIATGRFTSFPRMGRACRPGMLNIMETFPLGQKGYEFGSPKALQMKLKRKKLAYLDLQRYIGDPHGQKLPVERLLFERWAAARAKQIDADHANCNPDGRRDGRWHDTTYLSVVDRDGNMVSLIQSTSPRLVRESSRRERICTT